MEHPVEIIGIPQSSYVRVVRMVCEEKSIPYELTSAMPHAPEVNAINPFGQVPVMRHGDVALSESKAIATYLDLMFPGPKLFPTEPLAAGETEQWVSIVNTVIDRTVVREYVMNYYLPKGPDGEPDRAAIERALPALRMQVDVLDEAVRKTGYLAAGQLTFADINVTPLLSGLMVYPEGLEAMRSAKALTEYFERISSRPSFLNTVPPAWQP